MHAVAMDSPRISQMPILTPFLDGTFFLLVAFYGLGAIDPIGAWSWAVAHEPELRFVLTSLGLVGVGWRYAQFAPRTWKRIQKWRADQKKLPPKD